MYPDVKSAVAGRENAVLCLSPGVIRSTADMFVREFPGTVLYAVKANPHPVVIGAVVAGGVTHFDAASLGEIELVSKLVEAADISFNNPVKPLGTAQRAYEEFGVRDFVVDDPGELERVIDATGPDTTIQVRLGKPNPAAVVDLNSKFGTDVKSAASLLDEIRRAGARPAVSFHVGWQNQDPSVYADMLELALRLGDDLAYINIGGGFPSVFMPAGVGLGDFFEAVRHSPIPLRCEPGSAMVTDGAVLATQVLLRKDDAVYLNTGIYGGLNEHSYYPRASRVTVVDEGGALVAGETVSVTVFGPTCDSLDVLPNRYEVPASTKAGDWVLFDKAGAYSNALRTNFNDLGQLDVVEVETL